MKNIEIIKKRFLKEPASMRLKHLASDLARIAGFLDSSVSLSAIDDIAQESKFFIEWTAPEVPFDTQALLSEIQLKLALWQYRVFTKKKDIKNSEDLKQATRQWSARLLGV